MKIVEQYFPNAVICHAVQDDPNFFTFYSVVKTIANLLFPLVLSKLEQCRYTISYSLRSCPPWTKWDIFNAKIPTRLSKKYRLCVESELATECNTESAV